MNVAQNSAPAPRSPLDVVLRPEEMIEDREVKAADEDKLQHGQIGQQLADLAMSVPTPSNIALYGAWGSGKSGVGNLVRCHLKDAGHLGKDVAFARFDAFKYAENPLRRNFVSAMATELNIDDDAFHDDLYAGTTKTELKIPLAQTLRLVGLFISFLAGVVLLLALGCLVVASVRKGDVSDHFGQMAKVLFTASLAPAAILAAFVALAGKSLNVDRKTDKADSHEQFESLFRSLVKKSGKKVIVFVDELDRCSAPNVVATLDAMRTFLGVPGCVFIVAADRQVLEQALTTALQQATPNDTVNPYYSEGSAYLDKVFQYEVTVPPLLQHSVTKFAVELVATRPGVWSELQDLELVVSVLVPSHVRSPRRVKALLNAFALAYRLAEARERSGLLKTDVRGRAAEVARLVCLRIEFPLFAQYLVLDHRLPMYVLALEEAPDDEDALWEKFPFATDEVRDVAKRFAEIKASVATLVSSADDEDEDLGQDDGERSTMASAVGRKAGQQLLDYLSRTRDVPGPGRDLIHLRSTGSVVGLESDQAERIEALASNGSVAQILELVARFDEPSTQAVLGLLVEHARVAIGVESQGVAKVLLALAGVPSADLSQHGGSIANAIAPTLELYPTVLDSAGLPGAWRLGVATNSAAGRRLHRVVLDAPETRSDPAIGLMVLRDADAAVAADSDATQLILQSHLIAGHVSDTAEVIEGLDPATAVALLREDPVSLARVLTEALEPPTPASAVATATTPAALTAAQAAVGAAAALVEDESDPDESPDAAESEQIYDALSHLLAHLSPGPGGPAQALLEVLLLVDTRDMRNTIETALATIGEIQTTDLTAQILKSARRRHAQVWARWLDPLSPAVAGLHDLDSELDQTASALWGYAMAAEKRPKDAELSLAGAALMRLVEGRPADRRPSLASQVEAAFGESAEDEEGVHRRRSVIANAQPLVTAGVISERMLVAAEYHAAVETLGLELEPQLSGSQLVVYVCETVQNAVAVWDPARPTGGMIEHDELEALAVAADECAWLPEPWSTSVKLSLRAAWAPADDAGLDPLPLTTEVLQLWSDFGVEATTAVQSWLTLAQLDVDDLVTIGRAFVSIEPPSPVLAALERASSRLTKATKLAGFRQLLSEPGAALPSRAVLSALGSASIAAAELGNLLTARYTACTNNHQRKQVLELWSRLDVTVGVRRDLIDRIVIPMLGENQTAAEHVLDYAERLCVPFPPKTKKRLGEAILAATRDTTAKKRAHSKMEAMGYSVKKTGNWLFGKTTQVDTGNADD